MLVIIILSLIALVTGVYMESGPVTAFSYGLMGTFIIITYTLVADFNRYLQAKIAREKAEKTTVSPVPKKDAEFQKYFQVNDIFQDHFLSTITGRYMIDILKFDSYMEKTHGYDIEKDGSLKKFITERFGEDATKFIESLFSLKQ